jgi:hypothetical protein
MNSSTSEILWMSPVEARSAATHSADSQVVFEGAVAAGILTAVRAGLFTASVAVGSTPSQDVQYVLAMLNQGNYQAAVTGTSLVVNW